MDIDILGLRDRRIAASDEYLDGNERRERNLLNAHEGPWDPRRPHVGGSYTVWEAARDWRARDARSGSTY